jgi:hypothetical protein
VRLCGVPAAARVRAHARLQRRAVKFVRCAALSVGSLQGSSSLVCVTVKRAATFPQHLTHFWNHGLQMSLCDGLSRALTMPIHVRQLGGHTTPDTALHSSAKFARGS